MQKAIALVALLPVLSVLHRFRGGGLFVWQAPIHRRYVASLLLAAFMFINWSWQIAAFVALQYLLLVLLPWGRWYTLGHIDRDVSSGTADPLEAFLERITAFLGRTGSDFAAFVLRNLLCLLPCFLCAYYLHNLNLVIIAVAIAVVIPEVYRLCWRFLLASGAPTVYAEWVSGVLIGSAIAGGLLTL